MASSSSSSSLATGISLCNAGAQLLQQGRYVESIQKLTAAMKVCRQACAAQQEQQQQEQGGASSNSNSNPKEGTRPVRFDLDVLFKPFYDDNNSNSNIKNHHPHHHPRRSTSVAAAAALDGFIFQSPLRLPTLLQNCNRSIHLIMAVICFNLGIAYHVLAVTTTSTQYGDLSRSNKSTTTLKKALQLYKTAERMQRTSSASSKALFRCALLNNIGHIFKSLQETKLSTTYYNRLLSLILFMVSFQKTNVVHYEHYLGFLLSSHNNSIGKKICASAA